MQPFAMHEPLTRNAARSGRRGWSKKTEPALAGATTSTLRNGNNNCSAARAYAA
jgi:hypothetical protein